MQTESIFSSLKKEHNYVYACIRLYYDSNFLELYDSVLYWLYTLVVAVVLNGIVGFNIIVVLMILLFWGGFFLLF